LNRQWFERQFSFSAPFFLYFDRQLPKKFKGTCGVQLFTITETGNINIFVHMSSTRGANGFSLDANIEVVKNITLLYSAS